MPAFSGYSMKPISVLVVIWLLIRKILSRIYSALFSRKLLMTITSRIILIFVRNSLEFLFIKRPKKNPLPKSVPPLPKKASTKY